MRFSMGGLGSLILPVCLLGSAVSGQAQQPDPNRGIGVVEEVEEVPVGRLVLAVIGIDKYDHWLRLTNAVSDAVGLQKALAEKAGFTVPVEPLLDQAATKPAIMSLIEDRLPRLLEPNDQLILFFAGHGHTRVSKVGNSQVETGYLVPVEAPSGEEEQWSAYIRIEQFLDAVNELPARHVLVILDACHSGFALGSAIEKSRGTEEFKRDLSRKVSRRVVTSALRDQQASDRGPVPNHSLFTGTFVDGLSWGKIDLDGNGIVTSSEIGLYLQQTVGQATGSEQTPDFGAFGLDDRGELIIPLTNQTFSALTARAMNALDHGRHGEFVELVGELAEIRPDNPETLYLQYRLGLLTGDIDAALRAVSALEDGQFERGIIPLGSEDLWDLRQHLAFWRDALQLEEDDAEIAVEVVLDSGVKPPLEPLGDIEAFPMEAEVDFRLRVTNRATEKRFVHLFVISEAGRVRPGQVWSEPSTLLEGIEPGETVQSSSFRKPGVTGIEELRLIVSPARVDEFVFPPDAKSGASPLKPASVQTIAQSKRRTVRLAPPR